MLEENKNQQDITSGARRMFLKTAGTSLAGVGAIGNLSGSALAEREAKEKRGDEKGDNKNNLKIDTEVLADSENEGVVRVNTKNTKTGEATVTIYHFDEDQDGRGLRVFEGSAEEVESVEAQGTEIVEVTTSNDTTSYSTNEDTANSADITTEDLPETIERSKEIDREIGDCPTDDGYEHQWKGVTFELTEVGEVVGKGGLSTATSATAIYYLSGTAATIISLGAGFIATVLLGLGTGREFTVGGKDGYIELGFTKEPQLQVKGGLGYDEDPNGTTNIGTAPGTHFGGKHSDTAEGIIQDLPYGQ